jgi:hypothetical protein
VFRPDGRLLCVAGDGSEFAFKVAPQPPIKTEEDVRVVLPVALKKHCEAMPCEDFVSEKMEETTRNGVRMTVGKAHGTAHGTKWTMLCVIFRPKDHTYFMIAGGAPTGVYSVHEDEMSVILNSIATIDD